MQHTIIHKRDGFYSAFPHIIDHHGELLVVFREAGASTAEAAHTHTHTHQDIDARICLTQSSDGGETWSPPVTIIRGDAQSGITPSDPALTVLQDGAYLARYARWQLKPIAQRHEINGAIHRHFVRRGMVGHIVGGGFSISRNQGKTWHAMPRRFLEIPTGFASREAVIELSDGTLLLPIYAGYPQHTEISYLARSWDGGKTWQDISTIAGTPLPYRQGKNYNETALIVWDDTTLLALLRVDTTFTTDDDQQTLMSEGGAGELEWAISYDLGFTWSAPRPTGIYGQPAHLLRLQDGRVLVTYGVRKAPYGVAAQVMHFSPDTGFAEVSKVVIRADGGGWDVGYPATAQRPDGSLYTVYYLYDADDPLATRYIAGTHWTLD